VKGAYGDIVVEAHRVLGAEPQERVAKAVGCRKTPVIAVDHADRRDLELVVTAQVPTELHATHVELLEREAAHVPEDGAALGGQAEREADRVAPGRAAAERAHRHPDRARPDVALELA